MYIKNRIIFARYPFGFCNIIMAILVFQEQVLGISNPPLATQSSLFVTPLPPSKTKSPFIPNTRKRTRSKNKYNNRYRETIRAGGRGKDSSRNLRVKPQQNYPDKSQHLDKLFEIAGQRPKDKQLNTLLQIAGGRPNRQSGTAQNQPDNESSFK